MLKSKESFSKSFTCCYFGIYEQPLARDQVLLHGLKENGVRVIYCVDSSWFFLKFIRLAQKHWKLRDKYDFMVVGYLSNIVVPWARILSGKRIIYNALNSMYEGIVLDREEASRFSFKAFYIWLVDFLAFRYAHLSLVETENQKKFIRELFKIKKERLIKLWTGADDRIFYPDPKVEKHKTFSVVFRGWFIPGTGVEYVLEAARILKGEEIKFLIIGRGTLKRKVKKMIQDFDLKNVELITEYLLDDALRRVMLSCHVMLGQFADHPRMERTIQNKTFEALALEMSYITRDSISNRELLEDGKNCLFVKPADASDLAKKILELKDNPELRKKIAENGYKLYKEKLTPKVLGRELMNTFSDFL